MKLSMIFFIVILIGCYSNQQRSNQPKADTVYVSWAKEIKVEIKDTSKIDSFKKVNDSLKTALFRANYKVIRVKYYVGLANKNPKKYNVFLRGWINGLFENQ